MTDKPSPGLLSQLAVNKLVGSLQDSVKRMDSFIASEIRKQFAKTFAIENVEQKQSTTADKNSTNSNPETSHDCPLDKYTCAQAASQMIKIRKYMLDSVKPDFHPFVVRHVIATAIQTRNIPLVRLVLKDGIDILDFRSLDYWLTRCGIRIPELLLQTITPSSLPTLSVKSVSHQQIQENNGPSSSSLICNNNELPLLIHCLPPDEFDWFSRDRLGKILSMPEACELFSIIKMSQSAPNVKELYINARRSTYWACPRELMEIIADTLIQLEKLTTLVLRGLCDDYMLKLIGQTAKGLKRLDVSGSQFVTDAGIKNLFFSEVFENPATYLITSWIKKNMDRMNPLVYTLDTLDYSFTSVTASSRRMVQHIPGTFLFKRVFAQNETDAYGHHVFIRNQASYKCQLGTNLEREKAKFENDLQVYAGQKGVKSFSRFSEQHPWRNCNLSIFADNSGESIFQTISNSGNSGGQQPQKFYGILIPNEEERRVQGIVNFQNGNLVEIYSVYPVNLNTIGELCPKLQAFRGIINDTWKMKTSLLSQLTTIDMFAEPNTTKSILESCPNLKKVRIRIIRHTLLDYHIVPTISSTMCRRTLEELWIAPGSYKAGLRIDKTELENSSRTQAAYYAAANTPRMNLNSNEDLSSMPSDQTSTENSNTTAENDCQIDDLVNLSMECVRTLLEACPKLSRLGDIAWWTPCSQNDIEQICVELKSQNSNVSFIWENYIFPDDSRIHV